jgi:hypothetical protein
MNTSEKKAIDLLVNEFWRLGYFTVSRRLGTYLPEPSNIGRFSVDVIGRLREKYAIGITLTKEDIFNPDLIEKINYLASRKSKVTDKPILLLIGVPDLYFKQAREILSYVDGKVIKNIKLTRIVEREDLDKRTYKLKPQPIFS